MPDPARAPGPEPAPQPRPQTGAGPQAQSASEPPGVVPEEGMRQLRKVFVVETLKPPIWDPVSLRMVWGVHESNPPPLFNEIRRNLEHSGAGIVVDEAIALYKRAWDAHRQG